MFALRCAAESDVVVGCGLWAVITVVVDVVVVVQTWGPVFAGLAFSYWQTWDFGGRVRGPGSA